MVREKIVNLFSEIEGFEKADELVQSLNARKRGSYNTKPKLVEYNPYTHMQKLYSQLASFLPIPLFLNEEAVFDYNGVKGWYMVYMPQNYEYEYRIYPGEQFNVVEAEITGTENFNIDDRIHLHEKLIKLLQQRVELDNAIKLIQLDVKELQKKYEISEYAQYLKRIKYNQNRQRG